MENNKRWIFWLAVAALAGVYIILAYWNAAYYHGGMTWERDLWGRVVRVVAEGGEILSYIAPLICYPMAYRLRKRGWLCLLLMSLPALLAFPMALSLGWRGWPLG